MQRDVWLFKVNVLKEIQKQLKCANFRCDLTICVGLSANGRFIVEVHIYFIILRMSYSLTLLYKVGHMTSTKSSLQI